MFNADPRNLGGRQGLIEHMLYHNHRLVQIEQGRGKPVPGSPPRRRRTNSSQRRRKRVTGGDKVRHAPPPQLMSASVSWDTLPSTQPPQGISLANSLPPPAARLPPAAPQEPALVATYPYLRYTPTDKRAMLSHVGDPLVLAELLNRASIAQSRAAQATPSTSTTTATTTTTATATPAGPTTLPATPSVASPDNLTLADCMLFGRGGAPSVSQTDDVMGSCVMADDLCTRTPQSQTASRQRSSSKKPRASKKKKKTRRKRSKKSRAGKPTGGVGVGVDPYRELADKLFCAIVRYRVYREHDLQWLFERTRQLNRHLDPILVNQIVLEIAQTLGVNAQGATTSIAPQQAHQQTHPQEQPADTSNTPPSPTAPDTPAPEPASESSVAQTPAKTPAPGTPGASSHSVVETDECKSTAGPSVPPDSSQYMKALSVLRHLYAARSPTYPFAFQGLSEDAVPGSAMAYYRSINNSYRHRLDEAKTPARTRSRTKSKSRKKKRPARSKHTMSQLYRQRTAGRKPSRRSDQVLIKKIWDELQVISALKKVKATDAVKNSSRKGGRNSTNSAARKRTGGDKRVSSAPPAPASFLDSDPSAAVGEWLLTPEGIHHYKRLVAHFGVDATSPAMVAAHFQATEAQRRKSGGGVSKSKKKKQSKRATGKKKRRLKSKSQSQPTSAGVVHVVVHAGSPESSVVSKSPPKQRKKKIKRRKTKSRAKSPGQRTLMAKAAAPGRSPDPVMSADVGAGVDGYAEDFETRPVDDRKQLEPLGPSAVVPGAGPHFIRSVGGSCEAPASKGGASTSQDDTVHADDLALIASLNPRAEPDAMPAVPLEAVIDTTEVDKQTASPRSADSPALPLTAREEGEFSGEMMTVVYEEGESEPAADSALADVSVEEGSGVMLAVEDEDEVLAEQPAVFAARDAERTDALVVDAEDEVVVSDDTPPDADGEEDNVEPDIEVDNVPDVELEEPEIEVQGDIEVGDGGGDISGTGAFLVDSPQPEKPAVELPPDSPVASHPAEDPASEGSGEVDLEAAGDGVPESGDVDLDSLMDDLDDLDLDGLDIGSDGGDEEQDGADGDSMQEGASDVGGVDDSVVVDSPVASPSPKDAPAKDNDEDVDVDIDLDNMSGMSDLDMDNLDAELAELDLDLGDLSDM